MLRRLRNEWYGDLPSNDKLTDGAVRGMVSSLGDPFTQYVEPSLAKLMEQDITGKFEGIGASLRTAQGGGIQIVRVFKNSPAEKAGVLANDFIESVNGRAVTGLGTSEVAALVRGQDGTEVKLMLRRGDRPRAFEMPITRGEIVIPLVTSKMVGANNDIAYISLFDFSAQANKQLTEDLKALLDKKPKALIFDLRDNPGGLLSQSRRDRRHLSQERHVCDSARLQGFSKSRPTRVTAAWRRTFRWCCWSTAAPPAHLKSWRARSKTTTAPS